ncbi:MAG: tetraacyldisaccharide 4'-kinase [Candidatus Marinimicrobia bacterium]|nr:tetraacyldisaccharide 4'-kinase [Candidatus Neomarinimicrobiota bacterium]
MSHRFRLLRFLLLPFSWLYRFITGLRNYLFDKSILKETRFHVPVISVGNITLGGTGKTPFVIALSSFLESKGYKVGVITRGYHRKSKGQIIVKDGKSILTSPQEAGDEPYLIAHKSGNTVIIADADRVKAARCAIEKYNCTVVIADDAFQHRYLARDLDIVLWDSYNDPAKEAVFPSGRLRESWKGLRRADMLLVTRTANLPQHIAEFFHAKQNDLYVSALPFSVRKIFSFSDREELSQENLKNKKVLSFCGLGNPRQFFDTIRQLTQTPPITKTFPDHHKYSENEINDLILIAEKQNCRFIITTEKDAVNLPPSDLKFSNILIVEISCVLTDKIKAAIVKQLPPFKN